MLPGPASLLAHLSATLVLEWMVCLGLLRRKAIHHTLDICLINSLTFSLATLAIAGFAAPYWPVELLVVLVEAILLQTMISLSWPQALVVSFSANGVTAVLGWCLPRMGFS